MRKCKIKRKTLAKSQKFAVKVTKLELQWDVGLSEGTSKTRDIGAC